MTIRDLLVHIDDRKGNAARLAAAIQLARKFDAHLVGLYVMPPLSVPGYVDVQLPVDLIQMQEERLLATAQQAEKAFKEATQASDTVSEWRCQKGNAVEILADHAHYSDLVILGQGDNTSSVASAIDELPDEIILTAGRPVLVIPHNYQGSDIGTKVIVGWDRGQRAARALHDAIPMLQKADEVSIMTVNSDSDSDTAGPEHLSGVDIAHHLARHDVRVTADHVTNTDMDISDLLLSRAADMGADLLVTGAYGHARWRELILGGVTRRLLDTMPIPVLMSY